MSFLWDVYIGETRLATYFYAGFLHGFFFEPEEGGDTFLRNVG
jgi:hypothetical protein